MPESLALGSGGKIAPSQALARAQCARHRRWGLWAGALSLWLVGHVVHDVARGRGEGAILSAVVATALLFVCVERLGRWRRLRKKLSAHDHVPRLEHA